MPPSYQYLLNVKKLANPIPNSKPNPDPKLSADSSELSQKYVQKHLES